jgi:spore germination protein KC
MNRKTILGLILIVAMSCGNGCWDRKELKTLAIVAGIGLDQSPDGKMLTTIQYIDSKMVKSSDRKNQSGRDGGNETSTAAVWVVEGTGPTVFGATSRTRLEVSRIMYTSQLQLLIFGKQLVEKEGNGIRAAFDAHARYSQERLTAMVLIAKGTAAAVLKVATPLDKIPALALVSMINSSSQMTGQVLPVRQIDLFKMLISKSRAPAIPQIEVAQNGEAKILRLSGTAVLKNDRWAGELSNTETRGIAWVLGRVQHALLEITGPSGQGRGALEVIKATGKFQPKLRGGVVTMEIKVAVQANAVEVLVPENWSTPEKLRRLGATGSAVIRREILAAWKVARRLHADIYGFGEAVGRKYPREWKTMEPRWEHIFPQIRLAIQIETDVVKTGELVKPLLPR